MTRIELLFLDFMDSVPVPSLPAAVRVEILAKYVVPNPLNPQTTTLEDVSMESVFGESITDAEGNVNFDLDVSSQWNRAISTLKNGRPPVQVEGRVFASGSHPSINLMSAHKFFNSYSPDGAVKGVVLVDPGKIIIGHTTATTSKVWFQLHGPLKNNWACLVELLQHNSVVKSQPLDISNDVAHIGMIPFADLTPGSRYDIALIGKSTNSEDRFVLARGRLQTPPLTETRWNINFTSCNRPTPDVDSLAPWIQAASRPSADALLLLGDQIYGDGVEKFVSKSEQWYDRYVQRYNQQWTYQPLRDVLRRTPTYSMLDDHDVADDWGVDDSIAPDRIKAALDAYRQFQHLRHPNTSASPDVLDYGWRRGPLAFYLLDERSHRGKEKDFPVLGAEQMRRFRAWADSKETREADVIVLGSSVPFAYIPIDRLLKLAEKVAAAVGILAWGNPLVGAVIAIKKDFKTAALMYTLGPLGAVLAFEEMKDEILEPDVRDQWSFPDLKSELTSVLDVLFDLANDYAQGKPGTRPRAVVVLSGDVHVGAFHLLRSNWSGNGHDHRRNNLIVQLTSSPSTHPLPDSKVLSELLDIVPENIDMNNAEFLKEKPDLQTDHEWDVRRFKMSPGESPPYSAEFLGLLKDQNMGGLVVEHVGGRRYRFSVRIEGKSDALNSLYELDLDANPIRPVNLLGQTLKATGTPVLLRAHEVGSGFGPPTDHLDSDIVVQLDTEPNRGFGLSLRDRPGLPSQQAMFFRLRDAFNTNQPVTIEYKRTGLRHGEIVRVSQTDT
jgi:hypothetical protein